MRRAWCFFRKVLSDKVFGFGNVKSEMGVFNVQTFSKKHGGGIDDPKAARPERKYNLIQYDFELIVVTKHPVFLFD